VFLQFSYRHQISRVLVDVDHSWHPVPWIRRRPAEEALRYGCVSLGGQQKIDGLAGRINRPITEPSLSFDLDVGLVQAPTLIGWLQMSPAALIQLRPVDLDPAPKQLGLMAKPLSAVISAICATARRYHRTHHMITSPG
jgi:hypothetical protein